MFFEGHKNWKNELLLFFNSQLKKLIRRDYEICLLYQIRLLDSQGKGKFRIGF